MPVNLKTAPEKCYNPLKLLLKNVILKENEVSI